VAVEAWCGRLCRLSQPSAWGDTTALEVAGGGNAHSTYRPCHGMNIHDETTSEHGQLTRQFHDPTQSTDSRFTRSFWERDSVRGAERADDTRQFAQRIVMVISVSQCDLMRLLDVRGWQHYLK
jgi:hypothetical protein